MKLLVKIRPVPARGTSRMVAGLAALLVLSYWALNLQVPAEAQQIDGSLIGLALGCPLSLCLFLSGFRARKRANHGDRGPVTSQMAPAPLIQRAA